MKFNPFFLQRLCVGAIFQLALMTGVCVALLFLLPASVVMVTFVLALIVILISRLISQLLLWITGNKLLARFIIGVSVIFQLMVVIWLLYQVAQILDWIR